MDEATTRRIEERIFDRFGIRYLRAENGEAEAEIELREADFNAMGLPFGGIHYFKQAAPGGWDETVDLTGQPRTCKELFAELEGT